MEMRKDNNEKDIEGFKEFCKTILPDLPESILNNAVSDALVLMEKDKENRMKSSEDFKNIFSISSGDFILTTITSTLIKAGRLVWTEKGSVDPKGIDKAEILVQGATDDIRYFINKNMEIIDTNAQLKEKLADVLGLYSNTSKLVSSVRKKFEMEEMKKTTVSKEFL